MEVFDNLPHEKKERIINAAMSVFAEHGYHKASAADIARAAGISKAMIFTYFGSKRGCYEFMCEEMIRVMLEEFNKVKDRLLALDDYFERIKLSVETKIDVLKQCPPLLAFATAVITERDEQVRPIINKLYTEGRELRKLFLTFDIDASKFKNPDEAPLIGRMTTWLSYGCAEEWSRTEQAKLDDTLDTFNKIIDTLKINYYKEEFLNVDN